MRTTLKIDDDVLAAARELAERNGCTLGKAVSELARKGFADSKPTPDTNSKPPTDTASKPPADTGSNPSPDTKFKIPTFDVPPDAPIITLEDVQRALEDFP